MFSVIITIPSSCFLASVLKNLIQEVSYEEFNFQQEICVITVIISKMLSALMVGLWEKAILFPAFNFCSMFCDNERLTTV